MGAAKEAALAVLGALVDRWIADGRDPEREAQRLTESYAARAPIDAKFDAAVAAKPSRPSTGT